MIHKGSIFGLPRRFLSARQRLRALVEQRAFKALFGVALAMGSVVGALTTAAADEGGVSVWLPGFFGSLAAAPLQPGWALQSTYYHTSVSAGADVSRAREIEIGRIPVNLNAN